MLVIIWGRMISSPNCAVSMQKVHSFSLTQKSIRYLRPIYDIRTNNKDLVLDVSTESVTLIEMSTVPRIMYVPMSGTLCSHVW